MHPLDRTHASRPATTTYAHTPRGAARRPLEVPFAPVAPSRRPSPRALRGLMHGAFLATIASTTLMSAAAGASAIGATRAPVGSGAPLESIAEPQASSPDVVAASEAGQAAVRDLDATVETIERRSEDVFRALRDRYEGFDAPSDPQTRSDDFLAAARTLGELRALTDALPATHPQRTALVVIDEALRSLGFAHAAAQEGQPFLASAGASASALQYAGLGGAGRFGDIADELGAPGAQPTYRDDAALMAVEAALDGAGVENVGPYIDAAVSLLADHPGVSNPGDGWIDFVAPTADQRLAHAYRALLDAQTAYAEGGDFRRPLNEARAELDLRHPDELFDLVLAGHDWTLEVMVAMLFLGALLGVLAREPREDRSMSS